MVLDRATLHRGTLNAILLYVETYFHGGVDYTQIFPLFARKLCKEGKSIDERAFRRRARSVMHKLINNCVDKFTAAKYLSSLSEGLVQQCEAIFDPLPTPVLQFTRGFQA
jgi:hypothetical protein